MMKMNDFIKMLENANVEHTVYTRTDGLIAVWVVGGAGEVCFKFSESGDLISA